MPEPEPMPEPKPNPTPTPKSNYNRHAVGDEAPAGHLPLPWGASAGLAPVGHLAHDAGQG